MVFSGIRERLFWDVGSTQKRRAKGKKGILNLNQMLAKGKVTRYAQAESRREEILLLYIPCLSRASVGLGNGLQRIISGTEASPLHCRQYQHTNHCPNSSTSKHTNKLLLWNSFPVNSAVLGEINQSDTNYTQKLQVMTSCRKSPALFLRKPVGDTILLFL